MKAADILLIPSISEASPMVIQEAAKLGTPVLSTRTISAEETVTEKGLRWVCDNSEEGLRAALMHFAEDPAVIKSVADSLKNNTFDNSFALKCFYSSILDN